MILYPYWWIIKDEKMNKMTRKEEAEFNLVTVGTMGVLLLSELVKSLKDLASRPTYITNNYNVNTMNIYNGNVYNGRQF